MVGFKAKARASAYFTKLRWRRGVFCGWGVCVRGWVYMCTLRGGWGVLEGWKCIESRGRRETTPLYNIWYIKFISLLINFIPST